MSRDSDTREQGSHRGAQERKTNRDLAPLQTKGTVFGSPLWVTNDKAHSEHMESALPPTADIRADIDLRRFGPTADLNGSAHDVGEVLILLQKSLRRRCGIKTRNNRIEANGFLKAALAASIALTFRANTTMPIEKKIQRSHVPNHEIAM
jgi:hypothetical protein